MEPAAFGTQATPPTSVDARAKEAARDNNGHALRCVVREDRPSSDCSGQRQAEEEADIDGQGPQRGSGEEEDAITSSHSDASTSGGADAFSSISGHPHLLPLPLWPPGDCVMQCGDDCVMCLFLMIVV